MEEAIPDSILKKDKLPATSAILTRFGFAFDRSGLPVTLEISQVERIYRQPSVVTRKLAVEQFGWSAGKIKLITYADEENGNSKLVI